MNKKLISGIIRIIISFALIGLLFFMMRKQLADIFKLLLNIEIPMLIIAIINLFIANFFISVRLKIFLATQNIMINLKEAIGLTLIGYFFNNFLPTAIGGDVVKAHYAAKKTTGRIDSFTSVFMDRFVGSFAIIFLALVAFVILKGDVGNKIVMWPIWILFFIITILLLIFFNKNFSESIFKIFPYRNVFKLPSKISSSLIVFREKKGLFLETFSISLIAQIFSFISVYFMIKGLYDFVPFAKILFIMPIVGIVSMLPSINGLGVREGAFVIFFKPLIGAEKAFALSLLWLFLYLLVGILGGFVYAFAKHDKATSILDTSN